jgi:hypothetical protein
MKAGKYKYITNKGEDAFSESFDYAGAFDAYGLAAVTQTARDFYIGVDGKIALQTQYNPTLFDTDGLGLVRRENRGSSLYGMLTVKGEWYLPLEYQSLAYRSCGLFCATLRGKDIVLDYNGKRLFDLGKYRYQDDDSFRDDRLLVGMRSKAYFMDKDGQITHGPYWSAQMYSDGLAYVKSSERSPAVFVDVNGATVMTTENYDYVSEYWENGVLEVQFSGKYGLISKAGAYLVEPVYDSLEHLDNNYLLGTYGDSLDLLDTQGIRRMRLPARIDCLKYGAEGIVAYRQQDKWGYMSVPSGEVITECIYESAGPMRHGRAPVKVVS